MNVDGWITIGFKGNTKQLQKDLAQQKRELEKFDNERKNLEEKKQQADVNLKPYKDQLKLIQEQTDSELSMAQTKEEVNNILDRENKNIEELNGKYASQLNKVNEIDNAIKENEKSQEGLKIQVKQTEDEIAKSKFTDKAKEMAKETGKNIKQIAKLALGVIGIRTAYTMVTRAMSTLSRYNEDMANKVEYIQWAMAKALEPIVTKLLDLAFQLLNAVDTISQALFNFPLFANATAEGFNEARKSINGAKKSLAGFDEMTRVSSNGVSDYLGASLGGDITSEFGQSLIKNKDTILKAISAITGALIALKLSALNPIIGVLGAIVGFGLYTLIKGIVDMINNPSWTAFGEILSGIGVTLAGITTILMALGVASGPIGWILIAVGALIALIGTLVTELDKDRDAINSVEEANRNLNDAKLALNNSQQSYTQAIKDEEQAYRNLRTAMDETGINAEELYKKIEDGTLKYTDMTEAQRKVYDAYLKLLIAQGNVKEAELKLNEAKKEEINKTLEQELANGKAGKSYDELKNKVMEAYEKGYISANEASEYLSRAMSNMSKDSYDTFMKDIPDNIKSGLDPYKYMSKMDALKAWFNGEMNNFKKKIEVEFSAKFNGSSTYMSGSKTFAHGGIYYPDLPKLAGGGIVNMPGRGIQYHGSYIGERGPEGILPLTDRRQMSLLGEAIGKYITINATINNQMNGRTISRELVKVNQNNSFATNGVK